MDPEAARLGVKPCWLSSEEDPTGPETLISILRQQKFLYVRIEICEAQAAYYR
jgi:hypothetical protein